MPSVAELNKALKEKEGSELKGTLLAVGNLIGILQENPEDWLSQDCSDVDAAKVEQLINERTEAKKNKDFTRSDAIRDELLAMKIEIKDTREGTTWKKIS